MFTEILRYCDITRGDTEKISAKSLLLAQFYLLVP